MTKRSKSEGKQAKSQVRRSQRSLSKKRPSGKDAQKKASLTDIVQTVVKIIKKPFGGRAGQKKRRLAPDVQREIDLAREMEKREILEQREIEQPQSNPFGDFFYTQTNFIDGFEDSDMLDYIRHRYPEFMQSFENDTKTRKQVLTLLEDEQFIRQFFLYFEITAAEFFKFLFRLNSQIFKTTFINKVKALIQEKNYV